MQVKVEGFGLIQLNSTPARLDSHSIYQHSLIYSWTDGRQMDTGICIHITELKLLKKYNSFETTPLILLSGVMDFFETNGFYPIQKLTNIWEIKEIPINES